MMAARGDESKLQPRTVAEKTRWQAIRDESWARLDEPERNAWEAFGVIDGQIQHRETFYEGPKDKKGQQFAVLDAGFADTVCRSWLGLPEWQMPRVWAGLQVLHDAKWQGGRDHESLCWHADLPLALLDAAPLPGGRLLCRRCGVRFRCRVCWVEGVWHDHGAR